MKYKLLILLVLFTMISGCSFTEEERTVLKLSSDGKRILNTEDYDPEDIEDADEPPELEISNPMPSREMTDPEKSVSKRSFLEMDVPEMDASEMPLRDN